MAGTSTARIGLFKPTPGTGETVDVAVDLNANWDKVDALAANPAKVSAAPVKRNTADNVTSGTDSLFETWTGVLKTGHWYEVCWDGRYNTSNAPTNSPSGTISLRLKAGGTVVVGDPAIATGSLGNINLTSPVAHISNVFDVPSDGTYTVGFTANSGGAGNTINILASGGTDNTGNKRCLWIKDMGEK